MRQPKKITIEYPVYTPSPELLASLKAVEEAAHATAESMRQVAQQMQAIFTGSMKRFAEELRRKHPEMFN